VGSGQDFMGFLRMGVLDAWCFAADFQQARVDIEDS
jgi:hypothetical protein